MHPATVSTAMHFTYAPARRGFAALMITLVGLLAACHDASVVAPIDAPPLEARFAITGFALSSVNAGGTHACGLTRSGQAFCWGSNSFGQLGTGTAVGSSPVPTPVAGEYTFTAIDAGNGHTCGVTKGGQPVCWGANHDGQLGNGTTESTDVPVAVSTALVFASISAGLSHTCGLTKAGVAYCWGSNTGWPLLGDGTTESRSVPVPVAGGHTFQMLSASYSHTCAVTKDGQAVCWGSNTYGELGNGSKVASSVPVAVASAEQFTWLAAGYDHTCGLTRGGAVRCWGRNLFGELGNGTTVDSDVPVPVSGNYTFTAVTAGLYHSCAIAKGGALLCWGTNATGQLGIGSIGGSSLEPTPVLGGFTFQSASAGTGYMCGIAKSLGTWCWGANSAGQLGNGPAPDIATGPLPVSSPL